MFDTVAPVEVNALSAEGRSALALAVECGHTQIVELLLDERADPNAGAAHDCPLIWSAIKGYTGIAAKG